MNTNETPFALLASKRQSDRKYKDTPVEKEKILRCLETARLSPSACNSQPWHFVVVDDEKLVQDMAKNVVSVGMNSFAPQAKVWVAVVL